MAQEKANVAFDDASMPVWNLDDLYPGMESDELAADLKASVDDAVAFETNWKGKLPTALSNGKLGSLIAEFESLQDRLGRIASYAGLLYAGDTSDPIRGKFYGDIQQKLTDISRHLLFFGLELNRIEADKLEAGYADDPDLARYKPWLRDLRLEKPYQLEDQLEELFQEKALTSSAAFNRLFDETMVALRFTVDGEEMTAEPTFNLLQDQDRKRRKGAFDALVDTFSGHMQTFTLITNTLAKDKEIEDRWRGFADVADGRHLANRVEREVVDALVASVSGSFERISHRYYGLKAKWLGLDKLQAWDRNAPLPQTPDERIGWAEAQAIVLDAYSGFSPKMADVAAQFFDKGWIDAPSRPGKAPGAFAHPTVPSAHPYVLVNYLGKPRDVMTLAHELGHGVHQVMAAEQGALMASTPLTLAETASVFGEMLTFQSLLAKTEDKATRKAMLAQKAEDMINTVVRQIAFYNFERKVHLARREGELTTGDLNAHWLSVQGDSLGPHVALNEGYETFWCYIPHFIHSPFYVYAYAFGDCLVNSLYAVYQGADGGFQDAYFDMLRAGGSKHHSELLAPFGLDATDPGFWNKGLSVIEGIIDELEAMEN
ncbi:MAG: M3 family oligoendopeptidase [Pseudomonadota bacterium]